MQRYLVVANLTLGGDELLNVLTERVNAGPCTLHILVPAGHLPSEWSLTQDDGRLAASERLEEAKRRFEGLGVPVDGEIGDERVPDAIRDVLRKREVDEIILSTLPSGVSRWLGMDLVSRVQRMFDVPVTHIVTATDTQ